MRATKNLSAPLILILFLLTQTSSLWGQDVKGNQEGRAGYVWEIMGRNGLPPVVKGEITGFGPAYFIVDVGSTTCVLDEQFKSRLKEVRRAVSTVGGGTEQTKIIYRSEGDLVKIGNLPIQSEFICFDLSKFRLGLGLPVFGMIGCSWLQKYGIEFDLDKSVVRIIEGQQSETHYDTSLPFNGRDKNVPYVVMALGDEDCQMNLDTGGQFEMFLPHAIFSVMADKGIIDRVSEMEIARAGGMAKVRSGFMKTSSIKGIKGSAMPLISVMETSSDHGALGMEFFRYLNFRIDFPSNTFSFSPRKEKQPENDCWSRMGGIFIYPKGSAMPTVYQIWKDSPMGRAGVLEGDKMLRFGSLVGKEINKYTVGETFSEFKNGQFIEIEYSRKGEKMSAKILVED